jgi:hypothetical protein
VADAVEEDLKLRFYFYVIIFHIFFNHAIWLKKSFASARIQTDKGQKTSILYSFKTQYKRFKSNKIIWTKIVGSLEIVVRCTVEDEVVSVRT